MDHFNARHLALLPELSHLQQNNCSVTLPDIVFANTDWDAQSLSSFVALQFRQQQCSDAPSERLFLGPYKYQTQAEGSVLANLFDVPMVIHGNEAPEMELSISHPRLVTTVPNLYVMGDVITGYLHFPGRTDFYAVLTGDDVSLGEWYFTALGKAFGNTGSMHYFQASFRAPVPGSLEVRNIG